MAAHAPDALTVGGRRLAIRNLDRVIFPATRTTKAAPLDYYSRAGVARAVRAYVAAFSKTSR